MIDENIFFKYRPKIEKALVKKALGYSYNEIIEEYGIDEEGEKLQKKKVTKKNVPPDISAVKVLLDILNLNSNVDFTKLTDEELKQEIKKAMDLLAENYTTGVNKDEKN